MRNLEDASSLISAGFSVTHVKFPGNSIGLDHSKENLWEGIERAAIFDEM